MIAPVDLGDDEFLLLGRMVSRASNVEFELRDLVAGLIGGRHGKLIAAGESAARLMALAKAMAEQHESPERVAVLKDLFAECKAAFERRHHFVHGLWAFQPSNMQWITLRSRQLKTTVQVRAATLDDLRELGETFLRLRTELSAWRRPSR